jgi:hypothetical protein
MPVQTLARCHNCHQMLPHRMFPSVATWKDRQGKTKRRYSVYCRPCITANPVLWNQSGSAQPWEKEIKDR